MGYLVKKKHAHHTIAGKFNLAAEIEYPYFDYVIHREICQNISLMRISVLPIYFFFS